MLAALVRVLLVRRHEDRFRRQQARDAVERQLQQRTALEQLQKLLRILIGAERAQARSRTACEDHCGSCHVVFFLPTAMMLSPERGSAPSSARSSGTKKSNTRDWPLGSARRANSFAFSHQAARAKR